MKRLLREISILAASLLGLSCASADANGDGSGGATSGSGGAGLAGSGSAASGAAGNSGLGGVGGGRGGSAGAPAASSGTGGVGGISAGGASGTGASSTGGATGASGGENNGGGGLASGGAGGSAGHGGSGAGGGSGGAAAGPFVCNQLTGGKLTEEWFIAGFEKTVDDSRWQVKWREDAYVEVWADAQSSFWSAQVDSTCTNGSTTPDRLVFGTVSFKYKTQAEWRTGITQAVNNFKARWPSLRRVDLVTQIRGPNNQLCPTAPIAGETIAVPAEQDAAMAEVAAAFPGFVFVGPEVEAHSCADFQGGGPHLTAAGNMANVSVLADYFVQVQ
jgi:hypothetical protein